MSKRTQRAAERGHATVNLMPVMSIMVILIPMLLFIFTFHEIRTHKVQAPKRGPCNGKCVASTDVQLTVMVGANRTFDVSWRTELTPDLTPPPTIEALPNGEYDFDTLNRRLADLKQKLEAAGAKAGRVNLSADDQVVWDTVSSTLDAIGFVPDTKADELFTKVVFSLAK